MADYNDSNIPDKGSNSLDVTNNGQQNKAQHNPLGNNSANTGIQNNTGLESNPSAQNTKNDAAPSQLCEPNLEPSVGNNNSLDNPQNSNGSNHLIPEYNQNQGNGDNNNNKNHSKERLSEDLAKKIGSTDDKNSQNKSSDATDQAAQQLKKWGDQNASIGGNNTSKENPVSGLQQGNNPNAEGNTSENKTPKAFQKNSLNQKNKLPQKSKTLWKILLFSMLGPFLLLFFLLMLAAQLPNLVFNSSLMVRPEWQDSSLSPYSKDVTQEQVVGDYTFVMNKYMESKKSIMSEAEVDRLRKQNATSNVLNPYAPGANLDHSSPQSKQKLVSKENALESNYVPTDLRTVNWQSVRDVQMVSEAADALETLCVKARENGYELYLVSGYRSYETQASIYDNADPNIRELENAQAGKSEHQLGLAIDLTNDSSGNLFAAFGGTDVGTWVAQHAHEYGFIVRYQDGQSGITGYTYEPWHLRYVTAAVSNDIHEKDFKTYEEYLGVHESTNPYSNSNQPQDTTTWDTAYLISAYAASLKNFEGNISANSYLIDILEKALKVLKEAFKIKEQEVEVVETVPGKCPIYEETSIKIRDDNNIIERVVYKKTGEVEVTVPREYPECEERTFEVIKRMSDDGQIVISTSRERYWVQIGGNMRTASPTYTKKVVKKYVIDPFSKEVVLKGLGMEPEGIVSGSNSGLTNAKYVDGINYAMHQVLTLPLDDYGSSGGSGSVGAGEYIWPVESQEITSFFGYRPPEDTDGVGSTNHGGVDVGASRGSEIWAPKDGVVVLSGYNGGYGNCVILDHRNGIQTLFGHMTATAVSEGQEVRQGQVIGYVGSTGNSTGPHLHYSAYRDDVSIDPFELYPPSVIRFGLAPEPAAGATHDTSVPNNLNGCPKYTMSVSAYNTYDNPRTASGTTPTENRTVAGLSQFPFGTRVYIPALSSWANHGVFIIEDRGNENYMTGLDIWLPGTDASGTEKALVFGRQNLEVYILPNRVDLGPYGGY